MDQLCDPIGINFRFSTLKIYSIFIIYLIYVSLMRLPAGSCID